MGNGRKRSRCSNWSHDETMALAELKKDAFLNKEEGGLAWEQIARTISNRFPQIRSADQCRRRWDTLRKDYNHIEEYCIETGQDHWQLDDDELISMKLDTAYRQDWYNIVKEVCSQRKRKEWGACRLIALKRKKRVDSDSPSSVCLERTPETETLYVTPPASSGEPVITIVDTHHEQSTTVNAQISTRPSSEVGEPSPEEECRRLKRENDALLLQLAQLRQHGQVTQQDQRLDPTYQVPQTFPADVGVEVKEPLHGAVMDSLGETVEPSSKAKQIGSIPKLMVPRSRSMSPKCFNQGYRPDAINFLASKDWDPLDCSGFSPILSIPAIELWDFYDGNCLEFRAPSPVIRASSPVRRAASPLPFGPLRSLSRKSSLHECIFG